MEIENLSLEESFAKIEELMNEMSEGDVSLTESFEKYKLGMELLAHCNEQIDGVEKQIQILSASDLTQ